MADNTIVRVEHATVRYNLSAKKRHSLRDYLGAMVRKDLLFQEFLALQDVNLEVQRGESWGFVGQNGSGKSTLLKLISGILRPYKGSVTVKGSVAPLLELGAGFDLELTGRENIEMNGLILGMTKAEIRKHFDEIVDFAGVAPFLDVPVKNYSSGMKSRLGFSIATCARADILIADEVLSTGDKAFQQKCEDRMKKMLGKGTTLLYVSHSLPSVQKLCDNALWLSHGHVVLSGKASEILPVYDMYTDKNL